MPIPDTPQTRQEQYLNAIATGDASGIPDTPQCRQEQYLNAIATGDASGIPDTPQCRQEQYLDAIAKNGGGGGGGGGGWTLIGSDEFNVSTTSTTATEVGTVDFGEVTSQDIIIIHIRDKAGKRDLYFYGSDGFAVVGHRTTLSSVPFMYSRYNNGYTDYSTSNGAYGIYPSSLNFTDRQVVISAKYHGTYSTKIDGTYTVEIYKLTPPFTMFE